MTAYRYRAMSADGRLLTGIHEAPSEDAVIRHLRRLGSYPVSTTPAGFAKFRKLMSPFKRPSTRSLARATQELGLLVAAGIELDRALSIVMNLDGLGSLKEPLVRVRARIRDGASFADAFSKEDCFPRFYVSVVRAGEHGGGLETVLGKLGDYLSRSAAVRDNITSALVYPSILLATACCSIVFILVFVLPQFEPLFAEAGQRLPLSTRVVMSIGHFLSSYWWLIAISLGGLTLYARKELKKPNRRIYFHACLLRLPLFGKLIISVQVERFFRTLGTLVANGVPLPSAFVISRDTVTNERIAERLRDAAIRLREGERLADRLQRTKIFPAAALDLVRIGEETGKLDAMLLRQADIEAQRLKETVDRLLALLVPVLTIVLGVIVAGLIASMLVALLSINDLALP